MDFLCDCTILNGRPSQNCQVCFGTGSVLPSPPVEKEKPGEAKETCSVCRQPIIEGPGKTKICGCSVSPVVPIGIQ